MAAPVSSTKVRIASRRALEFNPRMFHENKEKVVLSIERVNQDREVQV